VRDQNNFHPAFDMPTTAEQAIAMIEAQGDPLCFTFDHKKMAVAAELLRAEAKRKDEVIASLETLRPHWAKGYTSDSIAAQTATAALSQLWVLLGADNQTQAMMKLRSLTAAPAAASPELQLEDVQAIAAKFGCELHFRHGASSAKPAPGTVGALKALISAWPDPFLVSVCAEEMDGEDVLIEGHILEGTTSDGPGHVTLNVREARPARAPKTASAAKDEAKPIKPSIEFDLQIYGQSFEVDGKRVAPHRVKLYKRGGV
jgi:hypothetical protein